MSYCAKVGRSSSLLIPSGTDNVWVVDYNHTWWDPSGMLNPAVPTGLTALWPGYYYVTAQFCLEYSSAGTQRRYGIQLYPADASPSSWIAFERVPVPRTYDRFVHLNSNFFHLRVGVKLALGDSVALFVGHDAGVSLQLFETSSAWDVYLHLSASLA